MMPARTKSFTAFVLAVFVAVTSLNIGMARGAAAAIGQVTLCIGNTVQLVYVDSTGAPTAAPHFCPECIVTFSAAHPEQAPVSHDVSWDLVKPSTKVIAVADAVVLTGFRGRAPPLGPASLS